MFSINSLLQLTVTLALVNLSASRGTGFDKCCKFGETVNRNNTTYTCVEESNKRLQVLTVKKGFLNKSTVGECLDVISNEGAFLFKTNDTKIVGESPYHEEPFPKCCPSNFVYDPSIRSCVEGLQSNGSFIQGNVLKIGIPNCRVVIDYRIESNTDYEYQIIDVWGSKTKKNKSSLSPGSFCVDESKKGLIFRECQDSLEVCDSIRCVKKCCPDGQSFINRAKCVETYKYGLNFTNLSQVEAPEDPYAVIYNSKCDSMYFLGNTSTFGLDKNGTFKLWKKSTKSFQYIQIGNMKSYCIEHMQKPNMDGYFFYMCFPDAESNEKFSYTLWPKLISCVFLVFTIAIYFIIKETEKLFGKILINYCVAVLFQYSILSYIQNYLEKPTVLECRLRSFAIIFFANTVFTWSNNMCCDIWWTFGSAKLTIGSHQRRRELKRLLLYMLYGWGVPLVLTLIIFLFNIYPILPYSLHPFLAQKKCFFDIHEGNYSSILFFNAPHLVMQILNIVLFVKTTRYCLKVKNDIDKINDTSKDHKRKKFSQDKDKLLLILKLSVIMGLSFIFEVVSAFFVMSQMGNVAKYIEIIWDSVNCLQGFFIFVIFICKRNVLNKLLSALSLPKLNISTSSIKTQSTTSSGPRISMVTLNHAEKDT